MRSPTATAYALARVEGRRLLRHPAFLVSAAVGLLVQLLVLDLDDLDFLKYKVLVGAGLVPMAVGTGVVAILAASRARRDRTEELYLSLPSPPGSRAAGQLLAVGWAVAASAVAVAGLGLAMGAWSGLPTPPGVTPGPTEVIPSLAALAQGPLLVALVGATGVAFGARSPSATVAVSILLVGAYLQGPVVLWWDWDWQRWLLPITHGLRTGGWVDLGRGPTLAVYGTDATAREPAAVS